MVLFAFVYVSTKGFLLNQGQQKVELALSQSSEDLSEYFNFHENTLRALAESPSFLKSFNDFDNAFGVLGVDAPVVLKDSYVHDNPMKRREDLSGAAENSLYTRHHKTNHKWLRQTANSADFLDMMYINEKGDNIYSIKKRNDFATNFLTGDYRNSPAAKVFKKILDAKKKKHVAISNVAPYGESKTPSLFMGISVFDDTDFKGALVVRIPLLKIGKLLQSRSLMNKTGQVYAINMRSKKFVSQPRLNKDEKFILSKKLMTLPAKLLSQGKRGLIDTPNYNGDQVITSFKRFDYKDLQWGLIAEYNKKDLFSAGSAILSRQMLIIFISIIILSLMSYVLVRHFLSPAQDLKNEMENFRDGVFFNDDLTINRRDEWGHIANAMNDMKDSIKKMVFSQRIVHHLPNVMIILDKHAKIMQINADAKHFFKRHDEYFENLRGMKIEISHLINHDYKNIFDTYPFEQGYSDSKDLIFFEKIEDNHYQFKYIPLLDAHGTFIGCAVEIADVSQAGGFADKFLPLTQAQTLEDLKNITFQKGNNETLDPVLKHVGAFVNKVISHLNVMEVVFKKLSEKIIMSELNVDEKKIFSDSFGHLQNNIKGLGDFISTLKNHNMRGQKLCDDLKLFIDNQDSQTLSQKIDLEVLSKSLADMEGKVIDLSHQSHKVDDAFNAVNSNIDSVKKTLKDDIDHVFSQLINEDFLNSVRGEINNLSEKMQFLSLNTTLEVSKGENLDKALPTLVEQFGSLAQDILSLRENINRLFDNLNSSQTSANESIKLAEKELESFKDTLDQGGNSLKGFEDLEKDYKVFKEKILLIFTQLTQATSSVNLFVDKFVPILSDLNDANREMGQEIDSYKIQIETEVINVDEKNNIEDAPEDIEEEEEIIEEEGENPETELEESEEVEESEDDEKAEGTEDNKEAKVNSAKDEEEEEDPEPEEMDDDAEIEVEDDDEGAKLVNDVPEKGLVDDSEKEKEDNIG